MRRLGVLVTLCALVGTMAGTRQSHLEALVETKKDKLLTQNPYAKNNTELLRDKVFCLCTVCSVMPIMDRSDMSSKSTAYRHIQGDVEKGSITKAELKAAGIAGTFIGYEDFFHQYRRYIKGQLDVHGHPIEVELAANAEMQEAAVQSPLANMSQGSPHATCTMENKGVFTPLSHILHPVHSCTALRRSVIHN